MARNRKHQHRARVSVSGFTPTSNPEWDRSQAEKGRSSATLPHDSRPNRQRTRSAATRAAIRQDS